MGVILARSAGSVLLAISTALVIVALGVLAFLNPVWVGFEQARTHADLFTGYSLDDVHRVTDAVLVELIAGPATFQQQVGGVDVFEPRERGHLVDVRAVLMAFFAATLAAVVLLLIAARLAADRVWLWGSVFSGAAVLAGAVVVVGALFAAFFDAAFELFHRLFFASGSYTFDPARDRLVQLFPQDFWSETSIALAVVILVLSVAAVVLARRRLHGATDGASASAAPTQTAGVA